MSACGQCDFCIDGQECKYPIMAVIDAEELERLRARIEWLEGESDKVRTALVLIGIGPHDYIGQSAREAVKLVGELKQKALMAQLDDSKRDELAEDDI